MAYSPLDLGKRARSRALKEIAAGCRASPIQVALAWLVRQDGVIAIPKAGSEAHVHENRAALDLRLTRTDLAALDRGFPPPKEKRRRDAPRQRQRTNRPPARVRSVIECVAARDLILRVTFRLLEPEPGRRDANVLPVSD